MVIRFIIMFLLIFVWTACSPVDSSRGGTRSYDRDSREGRLDDSDWDIELDGKTISDSPDTIVEKLGRKLKETYAKLKECKSSTHGVPRNTTDIVTGALGFTLPTTQARECLAQNLEKASDRICEAQRQLDQQYKKYNNYDFREERLMFAIERVKRMEYQYKDRLFRMADKLRNYVDKKRTGALNWLAEEEALAYESIFEEEAYTDCYAYHHYSNRRDGRDRRY